MNVRFVYCLPIVLQQLLSWNDSRHAHIIICRFERKPPNRLQTFDNCCLSSISLVNPIQLLFTICNTYRPFADVAYHLQQHYLPFKPQISCLSFCCYLPMVIIVLWQKVLSTPKTYNREKIFYCYCKRNKKALHKT